jgi:hypothetical protein
MRIWFGLILNNEGVMEKRGKCVVVAMVCGGGGGVRVCVGGCKEIVLVNKGQ